MRLRKKKSLRDQASDYVVTVRPQVEAAVTHAREVIGDFVDDTARPALNDAKVKAGPALAEARERATVYAADAREKAGPVIADARAKAAPVVATGVAYAAEKATHAKELADAKVAELTSEPGKKSKSKKSQKNGGAGSKVRKVLVFGTLTAVAGVVAKKVLGGGSSNDNWQSSYVPAPPPGPVNPTAPTTEDDAGGASPDEALSDQAEQAHPATTPDEPAEVVQIDEQRG